MWLPKEFKMAQLNFKHLRYFWMVGKTGSIARASEQLFLTPQSISGQLAELEDSLEVKLFRKVGRGLELSDMGRKIFGYADEIFTLGNELLKLTQNEDAVQSQPFHIGIADSVAKSIVYRVIEPILKLDNSIRLICKEGKLTNLLSEMSINRLDLVIADRPMPTNLNVRAYNHFLGESKLAIFGTRNLIEEHAGATFPKILNNANFLIPGEDFTIQKKLIQWFESKKVYPHIVAEFDDSALLKSFGQGGAGFFAAPNAIAEYICKQYEVEVVGLVDTLSEQLYAITTERRLTHPAIIALIKSTAEIYSRDVAHS